MPRRKWSSPNILCSPKAKANPDEGQQHHMNGRSIGGNVSLIEDGLAGMEIDQEESVKNHWIEDGYSDGGQQPRINCIGGNVTLIED